jgi:phospholipase C
MPNQAPIEHVVLIIKENHAFDNYFGTFPGSNGAKMQRSPNPPPKDPDHRHGAWLTRAKTAVRQQFIEQDIPAYFAYARQFTLCDNYFTDVAGPSTPNHLMLIAAASPLIDNPSRYRLPVGSPLFNLPSLPASLDKVNRTWRNYGGYAFDFIQGLHGRPSLSSGQFVKDAAAANLPAVSWVYAPHDASEHPPDPNDRGGNPLIGNVTHGMQWTVDQVNAVVQGGLWPKSAIFITWDDWGGWFDHVDPPNVEVWKDPGTHPAFNGTQFRYGSRVGCLVLSPYAKRGYISKVLHSHVSLLKFCETLFSLPPLNDRDAKADGMSDCFDYAQNPAPAPPASPGPQAAGSVSRPGTQSIGKQPPARGKKAPIRSRPKRK